MSDQKVNDRANKTAGARILVIEDSESDILLLTEKLKQEGYQTYAARAVEEALMIIGERTPDMLLLDMTLGEDSGLDVVRIIRSDEQLQKLPIIVVSATGDTDAVVEAINLGANDYITKPVNMPVLIARMETHLKMSIALKSLEAQNRLLARLSAFDEITGLLNKKAMTQALEAEIDRSIRYGHEISVMYVEIDGYKEKIAPRTPAERETVLKEIARRTRQTVRTVDIVGRCADEKFCIFLPETSLDSARLIASRLSGAISGSPIELEDDEIELTLSLGVTLIDSSFEGNSDEVYANASLAVQMAIDAGRNCIHVIEE